MANFYVTNSKYPSNPQVFTITLHKVASLGGEFGGVHEPLGSSERYWKVFIYTSGLDAQGEQVGPVVGDVTGSNADVDSFIEDTIADICSLIDWSQQGQSALEVDSNSPIVSEQYPAVGQTHVSMSSPVVVRVVDPLPGVGIDASTVSMKIDGFDVTPSVTGNKFDYTFSFSPKPRYNS